MDSRKSAEPASSLLAAQLAPRLSSQGDQTQHLTRETFSQLRQELVGGKYSLFQLDDSDTDVNKLICIVLKAGLEPISKDGKQTLEDLDGQALDCLDIIQAAIEKSPQALTQASDPGILGESVCAPLYSWLIIYLINLASAWDNKNIRDAVYNAISTVTYPQCGKVQSLSSYHSISRFLRACTTDILISLEISIAREPGDFSTIQPYIPSSKGALLSALDKLKLPHGLFGKRVALGPFPQASILALSLLECFSPSSKACHHTTGKGYVVRQDLAWVLNGYQRLWRTVSTWMQDTGPDTTQAKDQVCSRFVECAWRFCGQESSLPNSMSNSWLHVLADMLLLQNLSQLPSLQLELGRLFDSLAEMSEQSGIFVKRTGNIILPTLTYIKDRHPAFDTFEPFFKTTILKLVNRLAHCQSVDANSKEVVYGLCSIDARSQGLMITSQRTREHEDPPPPKRICRRQTCNEDDGQNLLQQLLTKSSKLVHTGRLENLKDLGVAISNSFTGLTDHEKRELLSYLGRIPCAMAGSLSKRSSVDVYAETFLCRVCDHEDYGKVSGPSPHLNGLESLWKIFVYILPRLNRDPNDRIAAMASLRRSLVHAPSSYQLQLASSEFGEFCLHSLRSSIRELRIATGHAIVAFVREGLGPEVRRSNFLIILEWLRSLSEKKETPLHETCILTLCRLAKLSGDDEMNLVLLRLLEYLGHPNPFVSAIAYTELSKLAQDLSVMPAGLFRPFWRTLSVTIVKNFQTRPYMAEQLCDLLGMKVDDFLRLTEIYILPYLVLTRKRDVIARIGASYRDVRSPFDICSEKNNLATILAFLLCQPSSDPESMIMSLLADIDLAFKNRTLGELVRTEPIPIACDLLKGLGDSGEKQARYHRALHLLAALVPRKSFHGNTSRKTNLLSNFIEEHVLGIITQFAHAINDFQVRQPLVEKKRNIVAIGEMIKIAKGHVSSALPQICACLRSALAIEELTDQAFTAWGVLISSLDEEEVEPLIDQTLSIVIRYWDTFAEETKKYAYELVEHILNTHRDLVRDIFSTMPSLSSVPGMERLAIEIDHMKQQMDVRSQFLAFVHRCQSENATVVQQTLTELVPYLGKHEEFLHSSVFSEQPDPVVAQLTRSLLDCCVKFNTNSDSIALLSAQCLGHIGCLDPNRVDSVKEKKDILVLSNFHRMEETLDFVLFFLQFVLVEAFLSASNTRAQGFLAYAMQNLLRVCNLDSIVMQRSRDVHEDEKYRRWLELPEGVRNILTPFLTSKYTVSVAAVNSGCNYPLFSPGMTHGDWLRIFVQDLLQKGSGENAQLILSVCSRIVKGQDISIASFLLPFAVLNRVVGGTEEEKLVLQSEMINILSHPLPDADNHVRENIILCTQSVFEVLDYLSRWLQGKKKQLNSLKNRGNHSSRSHRESQQDLLLDMYSAQIKAVEYLLSSIPPEVISKRAVECKSFSRALFHWEQYIRQCKNEKRKQEGANLEPLYQRLQEIYSQIDEPDGIEGISSHLPVLSIEQQVLEHRKAGRWATAQSWYELQLEKDPDDSDALCNLLTCLKESGQQDAILTRFEILKNSSFALPRFLPFAVEASWTTGKWERMRSYLELGSRHHIADFNIGVGSAFDAFRQGNVPMFQKVIDGLRLGIAKSLTVNSVTSLQSCHDSVLKLHALTEMEAICNVGTQSSSCSDVCDALDRRLDVLGGYLSDKQYLLGLRRATMELSGKFSDSDIAAAWLSSARLSRKGNYMNQAYHSMLHAARLKDKSSTIEYARLLWKDGHHRKAIQTLKSAIAANEFAPSAASPERSEPTSVASTRGQHQNMLTARAHLLLAKWTDRAGQTQSDVIVQRYREAIKLHTRWEKAHYYLGKHYNKILDSEKAKPLGKEAQIYLSGEASKLVIDNYLRSLAHGNKYVSQTLPKVLTLWLEHASVVDQPFDPKRGDNEEFQKHTLNQRKKSLDDMHSQLKKYMNRMPAALLFTILPQVLARICHPNATVYDMLTRIVAKAVNAFPQQGLWTVLAVVKSSNKDRASRGISCLHKITEVSKRPKPKSESSATDMRGMINQGQKLSEELLRLCTARVEGKVSRVSLARALGFNHKIAPCRLVVPFQALLTPSLPASHDSEYLKDFSAFPRDPTTIEAVLDDAQVLNSLQKPRKISIRGSDGKVYNILCKPKDDLRKDQRLMEFNNMINRFLKRDVEASKRRMYIKTYAVTPLNEECGLIEWVDNLRTLRDLVIKLLRERGITPNYNEIRHYLNEACSDISKVPLFTTKVLAKFPPVLHEWFVEMFPETGSWFAARLRYTRSSAVMSMVGYVLGLGDRHGENILFEEGTGGVLHVDFNCLFDKGLTFDKPELVPFRLTHNMVDAFGAYGYNGPFRRTCEITLGLLRQNEDALMTVLETFLHDPTTDFIGRKRRTHVGVPDTPTGVLENVRHKLQGLLPGESVPLSVDGHVDELIMEATDKRNLAAMYIGWCAFF